MGSQFSASLIGDEAILDWASVIKLLIGITLRVMDPDLLCGFRRIRLLDMVEGHMLLQAVLCRCT